MSGISSDADEGVIGNMRENPNSMTQDELRKKVSEAMVNNLVQFKGLQLKDPKLDPRAVIKNGELILGGHHDALNLIMAEFDKALLKEIETISELADGKVMPEVVNHYIYKRKGELKGNV